MGAAGVAGFGDHWVAAVRSIQTGSVNDYAAYQILGLLVTVATLLRA